MISVYTHQTVLQYANKIVEEVGIDNLYTSTNEKYPSAPNNYLLREPRILIDVIKKRLKDLTTPKTIHLLEAVDLSKIVGIYADIGKNLYIVYSSNISDCWKRFTIVKELCSAYTAHYQDIYIERAIYECDHDFKESIDEAYLRKKDFVNSDHLYDGDLDSETFAILLATEIMIPRPYRYITEQLVAEHRNGGGIRKNDIAKSLMIPETILRIYMEKNYL